MVKLTNYNRLQPFGNGYINQFVWLQPICIVYTDQLLLIAAIIDAQQN